MKRLIDLRNEVQQAMRAPSLDQLGYDLAVPGATDAAMREAHDLLMRHAETGDEALVARARALYEALYIGRIDDMLERMTR